MGLQYFGEDLSGLISWRSCSCNFAIFLMLDLLWMFFCLSESNMLYFGFQVLPETCLTFYGPKSLQVYMVPTDKADEFYQVIKTLFFHDDNFFCRRCWGSPPPPPLFFLSCINYNEKVNHGFPFSGLRNSFPFQFIEYNLVPASCRMSFIAKGSGKLLSIFPLKPWTF